VRGGRVRAHALDAFCDALWLEDGLAQNTIAAYRADLEQLDAFLGGDLLAADEARIFSFLAAKQGRASSAARRVSSLKRFYQYCLREGLMRADPTLKLDPPKRAQRFPKILSEDDVEALLASPNTRVPMGARDRAMLETLYATGLRVSELVALKLHAVNLQAGVARVLGKGSKERLVPLGEEAVHWIERYLREARPGLKGAREPDALFITARGAGMTRQAFCT